MGSPVSFIRSAALATSSAYRRLPIRWRLAGGSAALTLVILLGFAAIVGVLTTRQIRSDFNERVRASAEDLRERIVVRPGRAPHCVSPDLDAYGGAEHARIRVLTLDGELICQTRGAPDLGFPRISTVELGGYRVESRIVPVPPFGRTVMQYARPLSEIRQTARKVRVFLVLGVLGGALLALAAGLAVSRRAMRPIAQLTGTAREIERTRDPSLRVPHPEADDEVAELARTLEGMLQALDAARGETEATLARQRDFVADASHELRTPLTTVLANLELLAEELEGDEAHVAGAALRSSRRMKRLVGDLLLLARADSGRLDARQPTDIGAVVTEAAGELEPLAADHVLSVSARHAWVQGSHDELHRLVANLIENALRHTPAGTEVRASVRQLDDEVRIVVEDDGPGIPSSMRPFVFERFVRGGGDRAGSSGLGLAIVRAVTDSHGGSVVLQDGRSGMGARFVVRLPAAERTPPREQALVRS
ncbi:MAG: sensor histidine kinase [Solirubrobacteraceae bacterium]